MLQILYYLLIATSFFTLVIRINKLDKNLRLFIPLLLLSLTVEGVSFILPNKNLLKQFLFSIYTPVEYIILSLFCAQILTSKIKQKLILISIPLFVVVSIMVQFQVESSDYFYKYLDVLLEAPLILTWTLFFFFQIFTDDSTFSFKSNALFWISVGNMLFFAGSFFSYGFGSYLYNQKQNNLGEAVFWIARAFNLILYTFYIIGFLCSKQKKLF